MTDPAPTGSTPRSGASSATHSDPASAPTASTGPTPAAGADSALRRGADSATESGSDPASASHAGAATASGADSPPASRADSPPASGADSPPASSAGAATDLDARYGRTRSGRGRRPLVLGIIGVLALTGLVWLLWAAFVQSTPPVSSRLLGFTITSPTTAKATIQVDRSKNVEASCRLQAKAADFSIVGELTLTIPADSPRRQSLDATLTTQRDATAVVLIGCTTATAHRPR